MQRVSDRQPPSKLIALIRVWRAAGMAGDYALERETAKQAAIEYGVELPTTPEAPQRVAANG